MYALECPVCDEDLAGCSQEKRRNHMNTCCDGPEYAEGSISLSDPPLVSEPGGPNTSLYPLTCPVCDQHLDGWSEELSATHVNACLGGNWACKACRSEVLQPLVIGLCSSCESRRSRHDPSTHNDFEILQPFRISMTSPLSLDNFRTMDGSIARCKVILMGDAYCGKTWLVR
jgi:hypothetical protein